MTDTSPEKYPPDLPAKTLDESFYSVSVEEVEKLQGDGPLGCCAPISHYED